MRVGRSEGHLIDRIYHKCCYRGSDGSFPYFVRAVTRRTKIQPRRIRVGARLDESARYLREDEYWYRVGDTRRSCVCVRRQCRGSGIRATDQR